MKNKIQAILVGAAALFGLGFLFYVVLGLNIQLGPVSENVFANLDLAPIILMEVLYAILLTIIFDKWAQIKTFSTGAQTGFIIGAIIGGCSRLEVLATPELITLGGVFLAVVTFSIRFAVASGVICWVLSDTKENK